MHLTDAPLDLAAAAAAVLGPGRGGLVTFTGHIRNHHAGREVVRIDYSAYAPMAEAECRAIVEEASTRWPVTVELRHRLGTLGIGDAAVAVAVAADHRDEAFEACRWIIDEVKRRVPIWKREYYADGSIAWVDPTAPSGTEPVAAPEAASADR